MSGTPSNNGSNNTVPEISQETNDTIEKKTENNPMSPVGITICDWDANTCKKETVKSVSTPKINSNDSNEIKKIKSSVTWYSDTQEKHQDVKTDKLAETNPMLMVSDWDANFCKVEKAKTITGPEDSSTSSNSNYSPRTDSIFSLEQSEDVDETPTPSPRNSLSSLLSLDVSVLIHITTYVYIFSNANLCFYQHVILYCVTYRTVTTYWQKKLKSRILASCFIQFQSMAI